MDQFGVWTVDPSVSVFLLLPAGELNVGNRNGHVIRGLGETQLILPDSPSGDVIESGALFSFAGSPTQLIIRVGVSFLSEQQACSNAESEIGSATFDQIQAQSKALWNERLSRIEIDVPHTPPNLTELLYSSLYRASLTPVSRFPVLRSDSDSSRGKNNATDEAQGDFWGTSSFYFDSLYCRLVYFTLTVCEAAADFLVISWDTVSSHEKIGQKGLK